MTITIQPQTFQKRIIFKKSHWSRFACVIKKCELFHPSLPNSGTKKNHFPLRLKPIHNLIGCSVSRTFIMLWLTALTNFNGMFQNWKMPAVSKEHFSKFSAANMRNKSQPPAFAPPWSAECRSILRFLYLQGRSQSIEGFKQVHPVLHKTVILANETHEGGGTGLVRPEPPRFQLVSQQFSVQLRYELAMPSSGSLPTLDYLPPFTILDIWSMI